MGTERKSLTVVAYVSRHNSEEDREDDARWDALVGRVREIVDDETYADIDPEIYQ